MADTPTVPSLDRNSVIDAVADYILQANHGSYRPDPRKVLSVRKQERTAALRDAATPARNEASYFIEGELFATPGATRLPAGERPRALAERLVEQIWEQLRVWNAYDFTRSTSGMNR